MFKLNIECSRDIDELHIVFSDGTATVVSNDSSDKPKKDSKLDKPTTTTTKPKQSIVKEEQKKQQKPQMKKEEFLDLDADFSVSQEVIEKPVIDGVERPIKVADEIQNLEI